MSNPNDDLLIDLQVELDRFPSELDPLPVWFNHPDYLDDGWERMLEEDHDAHVEEWYEHITRLADDAGWNPGQPYDEDESWERMLELDRDGVDGITLPALSAEELAKDFDAFVFDMEAADRCPACESPLMRNGICPQCPPF